jgi:hypothetical protein
MDCRKEFERSVGLRWPIAYLPWAAAAVGIGLTVGGLLLALADRW